MGIPCRPICPHCQTWTAWVEHYYNYNHGEYVCEFCGGSDTQSIKYSESSQKYDDNYRFLKFMKGEK